MIVGDKEVVVYSKANCPACVKLKNELSLKAIEFTEIRVDLKPEYRQMMIDAGHRSVPILYLDGVHIADPTVLTNEIV
jgi:glutaredoxin 3